MKLSQDTIRRVQEAADILEVVDDFVPLKKSGSQWRALSPFTSEKTPSFYVVPQKGIFKDFSSGKAGDSITFVMEHEGMNFVEAVKYLAKKYGIEIQEEELTPQQEEEQNHRESLLIALNFAKSYFQDLLHKSDEGKSIGLSYFKERGFTEQVLETFELGYSLNDWNAFENAALKKGFKTEIIEEAGLVVKKEAKKYDRFRGRVMFPIHNLSGRVIAFGARTLKKDDKPKYLNSPESEVYHKSHVLYGIFQAKKAIRNEDNCYLVEGYTDVISLHQSGIENVVASSGTALTEDQIKMVHRFTPNMTVLYDGDPAGIRASLRGVDMILAQGMNVRIVLFPEGEDPDSYVRKVGGEAFKNYLKDNAQDFILFKTDLYLKESKADPAKKAELIRDIVVSISKIPDAIKRQVFFQECSQQLGVEEDVLIAESNKIFLQEKRRKDRQAERARERQNDDLPPLPQEMPFNTAQEEGYEDLLEELVAQEKTEVKKDKLYYQEQEFIRLLVSYGNTQLEEGTEDYLFHFLLNEIQELTFHTPIYQKILEVYKVEIELGKVPTESFFLHHENQEIKTEVINLITENSQLSENWEKKHKIIAPDKDEFLSHVVYTNLLRLKFRTIKKVQKEALEKLKAAQDSSNVEAETESMKVWMELKKEEMELAKLLGNVMRE